MKDWTITYSNNEGFSLVVYTSTTPQIWLFICSTLQWCIHHILCFIPLFPFPIIHWKDVICDDKPKLHFHFSYSWFGWTWGDLLCRYICVLGDDYIKRKVHYRHKLTDEELAGFCSAPSIWRFVQAMKELQNAKE